MLGRTRMQLLSKTPLPSRRQRPPNPSALQSAPVQPEKHDRPLLYDRQECTLVWLSRYDMQFRLTQTEHTAKLHIAHVVSAIECCSDMWRVPSHPLRGRDRLGGSAQE